MNRVIVAFALAVSFLVGGSLSLKSQEEPVPNAEANEAQILAKQILDEAKARANRFVKQASSQIIEQKEIELNAIRPRAETLRREMRIKDRNAGISSTIDNLTGKRAGDDAELGARDVDIKRLTEDIEKLKHEHDLNVLKAAWLLISHEKRMQIIESECLTAEETKIVQSTVKVEKINLERLQNSIGMKLRLIPAGEFKMGDSGNAFIDSAKRVRDVKLSTPFWMAETEVTQKQYQGITGENPSELKATGFLGLFSSNKYDSHPVDGVDWYQAVAFCRALSNQDEEKKAHHWYRLPTEAEWEYACRAGTTTSFHFGGFQSVKGTEANIDWTTFGSQYTEKHTVAVGTHAPNAFGLFEMHGNVSEWCSDWYLEDYCLDAPSVDPKGPAMGELSTRGSHIVKEIPAWPIAEYKATRGGAFNSPIVQDACLSNSRIARVPTATYFTGIRVVCEISDEPSGVTQEQYQQLADFESGTIRSYLLKARKEYYPKLKTMLDAKLEVARQLDQNKENSTDYEWKVRDNCGALAEIQTKMAEAYEAAGDTKRSSAAYTESAKWSVKEAEKFGRGSIDPNSDQQRMRLVGAAQSLINAGDFVRAQVVLDRANKISTSERGKDLQKIIDANQAVVIPER